MDRERTARWRLAVRGTALLAPWLFAGVPATAQAQELLRAKELERHLSSARSAEARCAWTEVERSATWACERAQAGSPQWLEAKTLLVGACYWLWRPDDILAVHNEVMQAARARDLSAPGPGFALVGPLSAGERRQLTSIGLAAVRVLQSRSEHEAAVTLLNALTTEVRSKPTEDREGVMADAALEVSSSLIALGRLEDAHETLKILRDRYPGRVESAVACVLLQQRPSPVDAYRGKFEGDGAHRKRMLAVREALPGARARLARALGREPDDLPAVPVGVADRPVGMNGLGAFTTGDPRQPDFPPVIVVPSEILALDVFGIEDLLVHELAHAFFMVELGVRYEVLPAWVIEGLPQALAGDFERNASMILADALLQDPYRFVDPGFWTARALDLAGGPCGGTHHPAVGLALWGLEEQPTRSIAQSLIAWLLLEEAGPGVEVLGTGEDLESVFERGSREAMRRLESRRQAALPAIVQVLQARGSGPAAVVEKTADLLPGISGGLEHGFILWERARALQQVGRPADALEAFDALLAKRLEQPSYIEISRAGRIECLTALGRRDAALRALEDLQRDALGAVIAGWAAQEHARLTGSSDGD